MNPPPLIEISATPLDHLDRNLIVQRKLVEHALRMFSPNFR